MQLKQQLRHVERWSFVACMAILAAGMLAQMALGPEAQGLTDATVNAFIAAMLVYVAAKFIRGFLPRDAKRG